MHNHIRKSLLAIAALAFYAVFMLAACETETPKKISPQAPTESSAKSEERTAPEVFTVKGWVLNPHTELGHTVIGFKTADNRLLNLIFAGFHQQLADGMYCRITYHRLTDDSHLPGFLREQTRKAEINYLVLDSVELLPLPEEKEKPGSAKKTKEG